MSAKPVGPRVRSLSVPVSLTPLVGRAHEAAEARDLLLCPDARLLTLTGPGGVGKTRLAARLAEDVAGLFEGDVTFVPLAPIHDPSLVVPTIAQAFGLRDEGGPPLAGRLVTVLRLRRRLLVLDNFEQVVDAAGTIGDLLAACPDLTVLATSRVPLRIEGEQEYPVTPLSVPEEQTATPDAAMASDAVTLFVQRAKAVRPDFSLTADNVATIAAICQRLDGLPLAIELAAARSRLLSPRALLARLDQRLLVLTSGPRNVPERHQTMRNAIAWSDSLLTPELQRLFRQLSVFVGGWSQEAAEVVVAPELRAELDGGVLGGLAALAEQSLITQAELPDGEPRFEMLETIREYALTELSASGTLDAARLRHAEWCRTLAISHTFGFFGASQRVSTIVVLREIDNLRAALGQLQTRSDRARAIEIAGSLAGFWYFHGHWSEGLVCLNRARTGIDDLDDATRCRVLVQYALLIAQDVRDVEEANAMIHDAVARASAVGDVEMLARAHQLLGQIAMRAGDYTSAERHFQLAFDVQRQHDNPSLLGITGTLLGRLAYVRGDHATATTLLEQSLVEHGDTFNPIGATWALMTLARISSERGEHARAARQYAASLDLRLEHGDRTGCIASLRGLADVATAVGFHDLAARLLAAVEANAESLGLNLSGARRERFLLVIERVKAGMTPDAFSAAWQAGRQMTIDDAPDAGQALVRALEQPTRIPASLSGTARIAPLSPRETDVLRLVAAGLSTAQIAEQLFLSPRTVTTHLTSIYNKLGFNSRVAAARFAADNGLV